MAKLVKFVITVGLLAGIGYGVYLMVGNAGSYETADTGDTADTVKDGKSDAPPRLEERWGFTTETGGG